MKAVHVTSGKKQMDFKIRDYEAKTKPKYDVLHEVMEFKEAVKSSKALFESLDENHGAHDQECVVLSRVLGHPEIVNSSHWKVADQCWVCQKWKYTLVFFDRTNKQKLAVSDPEATATFRQALFEENSDFQQAQASTDARPLEIGGGEPS